MYKNETWDLLQNHAIHSVNVRFVGCCWGCHFCFLLVDTHSMNLFILQLSSNLPLRIKEALKLSDWVKILVEKLTFYFFPKNPKLSISDKRNLMHVLFAIFFILRLELFVILSFAWQFYVTRSFIGPSSSSSSLDCLLLLPCGKWHKWQRKNDFTLHYTDYRDGHDAFELDGWIDETQFRKLYWVCQASTLLSRKFRSAAK
jgi:hypothetical protein